MTASAISHPGARRVALRLGTALSTAFAGTLLAVPALASTLPTGFSGASVTGTPTVVYNGGGTAATATKATVTVSSDTLATWTSFDVPASQTVAFTGCSGCTVLNRVTGGTASTIDGAITASGMNVWLINTNGVTMSSNGTFNGGSLVLSTLDDAAITLPGQIGSGSTHFNSGTGVLAMNGTITASGLIETDDSILGIPSG